MNNKKLVPLNKLTNYTIEIL